ncbi:MAG: dihydropteroate synthase [Gemmatimonadota bacterium]
MIVTPLAVHSPRAIQDALRVHGWDAGRAADAAGGIQPAAFLLSGLDSTVLESLVRFGGQLGLDVVTGEDWAVLAGSYARLSALARPWTVPEPLQALAVGIGMALPPDPMLQWRTARAPLQLERPVLMGILNITPDSFSDGGRISDAASALEHARTLVADGAVVLDVGGESTRPGRTEPVTAAEELRRVVPVIELLARELPEVLLSVDTVKAQVARAALDAGAAIVNDVSGFRLDPEMPAVVAAAGAGAVLMHSRGDILEIASYAHATYPSGVVTEVLGELRTSIARATEAGVPAANIVVDPGLGFSKTIPQNMLLLDQLAAFHTLGRPVLVGPSRKRFLAGESNLAPDARDGVTATACALAWSRGARLFRVHDVAAARSALDLAAAVGAA